MDELALLKHIAEGSRHLGGADGVVVGPGDDCAVVKWGANRGPEGRDLLLLTVDHLVEGRHFDAGLLTREGARLVGRKAVARSVSDVAAMAGVPRWALATAAIPARVGDEVSRSLIDGMQEAARAWGCPLVGGDMSATDGPLVLTVTVGGSPHASRGPVLRSGARPGDGVYVTGGLGGSLKSGRHMTFEPRVREAAWLADVLGADLHAMIDVSDGAGLDADRVATASGVVIEMSAETLPRHPGVADWRAAASDGEDYELLFTAAAGREVGEKCATTGTVIARIGRVLEVGGASEAGAWIVEGGGARVAAGRLGFVHRGG